VLSVVGSLVGFAILVYFIGRCKNSKVLTI
jgi:hypothetical protein